MFFAFCSHFLGFWMFLVFFFLGNRKTKQLHLEISLNFLFCAFLVKILGDAMKICKGKKEIGKDRDQKGE